MPEIQNESIHFVTGKFAETTLRETVTALSAECGFEFTIQVLPITVAALMTPQWVSKRIEIPAGTHRVVLPGYCQGDLQPILDQCPPGVRIERGPRDLRQLPAHFGKSNLLKAYGDFDIEIIAEINHASRLSENDLLSKANELRDSGADWIDVGCDPTGTFWPNVGNAVKLLCENGFRVSIDSLNPKEIELAARNGAQLVLSVNSTNREAAPDWGCEVVVIPDDIRKIESMESTIDFLVAKEVNFRLDPIIEPIGMGFANSLERYFETRRRWPESEMMMGIGNLSELTDVDSAGVNVMLLAICQELGIRSVLTTQVINWARSSVAECDRARRLVHYAVNNQVPAKHLESSLIALRDTELYPPSPEFLADLASQIRDHDFRLFNDGNQVHLVGREIHLQASDPFEVFDQLAALNPRNLTPSHAFYLGFELCKALTANTLGKQYTQDESLDWGHLTVEETDRHRLQKRRSQE